MDWFQMGKGVCQGCTLLPYLFNLHAELWLSVRLCVTPRMAAHHVPLSLGFSRQEYWSGLSFP